MDEEVVNGRLEKTRVGLYFSSFCAKSASSVSILWEEPGEDLVVTLVLEVEVDCLFKVSSL